MTPPLIVMHQQDPDVVALLHFPHCSHDCRCDRPCTVPSTDSGTEPPLLGCNATSLVHQVRKGFWDDVGLIYSLLHHNLHPHEQHGNSIKIHQAICAESCIECQKLAQLRDAVASPCVVVAALHLAIICCNFVPVLVQG